MFVVLISAFCSRLNTGFLCRPSKSIGAEAPAAAFGRTASADFASARYKFESPADAGLSNCSIGAQAPAAAFGKTASADFASAMYKY